MFKVDHIDHIAITVSNLEESISWYQEVLGLERQYEDEWEGPPIMLCAGSTCVALFSAEYKEPPKNDTNSIKMLHIAFKLDQINFIQAQKDLKGLNISYRIAEHENCHSIYFDDPDGHKIELTCYDLVKG